MNFLEAFAHMKAGGTVKRPSSTECGNEILEIYIDEVSDYFLANCEDATHTIYLTPSDIESKDWEIVE